MSTQEEIDEQQRLLATHRGTLAILLRQRAQHTSAHVPPVTEHGIHEAREGIKRIKQTLREWGVPVEEHPDDEGPLTIQSTLTPTHNSPLATDDQRKITDDKMAQARLLIRKA